MAPQSSSSGHAAVSIDGTSKIPRQGSADCSPSLIVQTNSLTLEELKSRFLDPSLLTFATDTRNGTLQSYNVELFKSSTLPSEVFDNCFDLLEANMSAAYKATSRGWNPRKKKEEMKHPAMRYLVLTVVESGDKSSFVGFLEFMITEEEGSEVIYTYELDILPDYQKLGLGKKLLDVAEEFGRRVGVEKAMLTVFDSNRGARRFYEREGYDLDEISPEPKVLRNGTIKPSTYHILSKAFWADEDGEDDDDENSDDGGDEDEDE
ncbi:hypothetical protein TWF192_000658 [Orbilia oligospora]|uniref:N-alpha-acetyltransferase 40 n=1 Tax=Orbilia oligospora TaxID=2813651 RepID=A0A6G1LWV8_ORBOL|nr:hypothetical protein TWF191_001570 [Orbilia oligospora]KAF3235711.1 hypothetical protein TWF192_000658 [Orbilia oligospora]